MAQRRLISPMIVESDAFLDMPISSQALYFHLCMNADDDGFVNPKKIMRLIGAATDDLNVLLTKRFCLKFENGVVVIKHWLIHNSIRQDRYHKTIYENELGQLKVKENGSYTESGNQMATIRHLKLSKVKLSEAKLSEVKERSPREITENFFSDPSKQEFVIKELVNKGAQENVARAEVSKFTAYWTELNQAGTRQRWQQEKTFEVQKRLATWFSRINQFDKKSGLEIKVISF